MANVKTNVKILRILQIVQNTVFNVMVVLNGITIYVNFSSNDTDDDWFCEACVTKLFFYI